MYRKKILIVNVYLALFPCRTKKYLDNILRLVLGGLPFFLDLGLGHFLAGRTEKLAGPAWSGRETILKQLRPTKQFRLD